MKFEPNNLYHVYNQGNNKQPIFIEASHYYLFLKEMKKWILPHAEMIAYCLMPNHFHFLLFADKRCLRPLKQGDLTLDPITNGIRILLSLYARKFNFSTNRSGSLFRQKTKAKCLSEIDSTPVKPLEQRDYYLKCFHYIHQNPIRAGLAQRLNEWEFSSFKDYAQLRKGTICNRKLATEYCSYNPSNFVEESYSLFADDLIRGNEIPI